MNEKEDAKLFDRDLEQKIQICLEKYFKNDKHLSAAELFYEKIIESMGVDDNFGHFYPFNLTWKIVSDCNLRCKHCYFYGNQKQFDSSQDLTTEQIFRLIDEIVEMNIFYISLTGGEIFLRNDIFEILEKLKSENIALKLSTNATLITDEIAERLSKILNPKIDFIQVSLDGAKRATHEKIRGKGTFDRAINGIKLLVNKGIPPIINCTVTSHNVSEMPDLYKLVQSLGLQKISISKLVDCSSEQTDTLIEMNELFKSMAEVIDLEKKNLEPALIMRTFDIYDFIPYHSAKKQIDNKIKKDGLKTYTDRHVMCHNHNKISIYPDGKVYLCYIAAANDTCSLGSLKYKTLKNIWAERKQNIFFQKRSSSKMKCSKCEYFQLCRGGCPLNALLKYNDIYAPDKNCPKGKNLIQNL